VLVSPQPKTMLPMKLPATAVLQVSFALIPARALDHGYVVFERSPAAAARVATAWFNHDLKQMSKVQGVDLSKVKITLKDVFAVRGNSITVWENQPVKVASPPDRWAAEQGIWVREEALPRGAIIGCVDLVDCVAASDSMWALPGSFHWILERPRLLVRPVPASGSLGFQWRRPPQGRLVRARRSRRSYR
jgi:hypothetical protein